MPSRHGDDVLERAQSGRDALAGPGVDELITVAERSAEEQVARIRTSVRRRGRAPLAATDRARLLVVGVCLARPGHSARMAVAERDDAVGETRAFAAAEGTAMRTGDGDFHVARPSSRSRTTAVWLRPASMRKRSGGGTHSSTRPVRGSRVGTKP